jgi:hypothetical protein
VKPLNEAFKFFSASFGPGFHVSLIVIPYPACKAKAAAFMVTGVTEAYALYPAFYPSSLLRFARKTPKNRRSGDFLPCKLPKDAG